MREASLNLAEGYGREASQRGLGNIDFKPFGSLEHASSNSDNIVLTFLLTGKEKVTDKRRKSMFQYSLSWNYNLTVCSYHVTYIFWSKYTLSGCLDVKELLCCSKQRCKFEWLQLDSNPHNQLVSKPTLNHLTI